MPKTSSIMQMDLVVLNSANVFSKVIQHEVQRAESTNVKNRIPGSHDNENSIGS